MKPCAIDAIPVGCWSRASPIEPSWSPHSKSPLPIDGRDLDASAVGGSEHPQRRALGVDEAEQAAERREARGLGELGLYGGAVGEALAAGSGDDARAVVVRVVSP